MKPLGLGYQKINMCPNFCMLYYLENAEMTECMTCGHSRYKPRTGRGKTLVAYKKLRYFPITPRLQRLFMSPRTAEHMTWHQAHHVVDGVMVHPFDGEAWKRFNSVHPHFSAKSKNMRLGLYTDGFNGYFVNGYVFHTEEYGQGRKTYNIDVCVKGSTSSELEVDYYGRLEEVVELQYHNEQNIVFLFKCYSYDTTDKGIRVDPYYGLVEINSKARLRNINDVFVFAKQCQQVYYTYTPSFRKGRSRVDWLSVLKTKPWGRVEVV